MNKKLSILIISLFVLLSAGVSYWYFNQSKAPSDKDEHGCVVSAGYSWCEINQKCLLSGQEPCKAAEDLTNSPTTTDATTMDYSNTEYGFNFSLPLSWKGYSIVPSNWEGNMLDKKASETLKGPKILIRHPLWTQASPRQDIPVMIFTLDEWNLIQQDKLAVSAAPIKPTELGRNSKYVFALPARYNFAFETGFEEVEKIIETKPLHALINNDVTTLDYNNVQYGFNFSLPLSWKGYSIVSSNWEGKMLDEKAGEALKGPKILIRHPLWTQASPRQDIPVMIFTLDEWNLIQKEKLSVSAAPIGPSELGRNSKYVFALPARYNFAFETGFEEVEKILETKPLHVLTETLK